MKSIVQEAPTLNEAIARAWERAGKPVDFSVRILEAPERFFFGLFSRRSAKVALFFENIRAVKESRVQTEKTYDATKHVHDKPGVRRDRQQRPDRESRPVRDDVSRDASRQEQGRLAQEPRSAKLVHKNRSADVAPVDAADGGQNRRRPRRGDGNNDASRGKVRLDQPLGNPEWTTEMTGFASDWMAKTLESIDKSSVMYSVTPQGFNLTITLQESLTGNEERERQLLASFSMLLMQALRSQFDVSLRGHKVVLAHKK